MNKGLLSLAFGAFCFGMSEFLMMSLLPDIAKSLNTAVGETGHLISSYALGVCVGGPLMVICSCGHRMKSVLIALMLIMVSGSILMAVSPNYTTALFARFLNGLPHGAFFGGAAIVANRLAKTGKETSALATVMMGMTTANLLGVPVGNLIGHLFSWRIVFLFNALTGILTIIMLKLCLPEQEPLPHAKIETLFSFLKRPIPWMLIIVTTLGNAGVFCWFSYINPFMIEYAGFSENTMPLLMLLVGASMCLGNYVGGRLSDHFTPGVVASYIQLVIMVALVALFLAGKGNNHVLTIIGMCVCTGGFFAYSAPMSQLLLKHSYGSPMMGGALAQLAFNLGNAIGALYGGWPIDNGIGIEYITLIGCVITSFAAIVFNFYPRYRYRIAMVVTKVKEKL